MAGWGFLLGDIMNTRIVTVVTRRVDGSFAEKFSIAINPDIESDLQQVKNFVHNFGMHGKAKWFEIYEGSNLYFGDSRVKPFYTTRVEE
jgi:hypothetical protein